MIHTDGKQTIANKPLAATPFGPQVGADPRDNPRWSEEEGRILSLEEVHLRGKDADEGTRARPCDDCDRRCPGWKQGDGR